MSLRSAEIALRYVFSFVLEWGVQGAWVRSERNPRLPSQGFLISFERIFIRSYDRNPFSRRTDRSEAVLKRLLPLSAGVRYFGLAICVAAFLLAVIAVVLIFSAPGD